MVLDWLQEFPEKLSFEYETDFYKNMKSPWNMPPELWADDSTLYDINNWTKSEVLKGTKIAETYDFVCKEFDCLLEKHGYKRDGNKYIISETAEKDVTIALFCHFGLGTSLISHVLNVPLISAWNSIFLPPSSVTTLYMEQHIASRPIAHGIFVGIGDTSHLYKGDEPISCSGLHAKELK